MLRLGPPHAIGVATALAISLFCALPALGQESLRDPEQARDAGERPAAEEAAPQPGVRLPFEQPLRRLPPGFRRRLRDSWARLAPRAESELMERMRQVPPSWQPHLRSWNEFAGDRDGRRLLLGAAGGLLAAMLLLRLFRRPADLVVCLEYPAEVRGSFSVQLARRKRALHRIYGGEASTRSIHHLVARETQFRRVRPGRYWVAVDGVLEDADGGEVIKRPYLTQKVSLRARKTARARFDLNPRGTLVTVRLSWDGQPPNDASVAVLGRPQSVRYARGGTARLELSNGTHRVVVGSGDRVAECPVEVRGPHPLTVDVELAGGDNVVFRGCPPAVEPYLRSDLASAARALKREGQGELANLLVARAHELEGQMERALELYQRAGDSANAIRLLQQVHPDDAGYRDTCEMLADAFEQDGDFEQAAAKVEEALRLAPEHEQPELQSHLAALLEHCDQPARALEVLEDLQVRTPGYPSVDTRIESLRKKISGQRTTAPVRSAAERESDQGRYLILERIGAGGMGVVFRAVDRRLGREVALKKLPDGLRDHPTLAELFLREARAAAMLNHPHIVTLFDADEEDGHFFITMELLAGSPLAALVARHGRLSARDTVLMGRQIADGLAYAHERRVVHRDIKPGNLFYTTERRIKIMDFGLAKMIEDLRRTATVVGGTPYYMAPEQGAGGEVGTPADVYAFGITLFELLTGRVPFRDGDVAYDHRHTPPPDPRGDAPDVSEGLARLILEMLEKDPAARPDAVQVSESLETIV